MKKISLQQIANVGILAALVFATSGLRIVIPLPVDNAAVHLGNVMCVLSGLLLGPIGGLAAGFGSFFYDLMNPLYAPEAFITLFNKFFIGFLAGLIAHANGRMGLHHRWNIVGGILGSLAYVALYLCKTWIYGNYVFSLDPDSALWIYFLPKFITSLVNGVVAVTVAVPLAAALQVALRKVGLSPARAI